jgi:cytidylate kinase
VTSDPAQSSAAPGPPLVTVSATYGAGGSVVAPALARRLEVPFVQRVTTTVGGLSEAEVGGEHLAPDEKRNAPIHWLLASFTQAMPTGPTVSPPTTDHQHRELRQGAEGGIRRLAHEGGGVVLGRAAAVILGKNCGFHVRLDGPAALRARQGAAIEEISLEQAHANQHAADRARTNYVRRLYHVDPADPALYHLVIDSTAIPLDAIVDIILQARSAYAGAIPNPTA